MAQYPVPQFIERESRIAFFLSFRQFFYLLAAGAICFILYYTLPLFLFAIAALIIFGGTAALAFIKVGGIPLSQVVLNSVGFLIKAKHYTWKRKEALYPTKKIERAGKKEKPLTMAEKSKLKQRKAQVELKTR